MAQRPNKSRGLGRGLSALMSDVGEAPQNAPRRAETHIPVEKVHPNPDQPRRAFEETALEDLANSIAENGGPIVGANNEIFFFYTIINADRALRSIHAQ